jgi:hypothetical protein
MEDGASIQHFGGCVFLHYQGVDMMIDTVSSYNFIVARRLKARISESEQASIVRQRLRVHGSASLSV